MDAQTWAESIIGRVLAGRYSIEGLLGMGGMGAVFRAVHLGLSRTVAVKLLVPKLVDDDNAVRRFQREAQAASAASRRGVTEVLDFDVDPVCGPFLAMELLQGESLAARLRRDGRLAPAEAIHIARTMLDTLAAVHAQGIVHRDLKPGNVFLSVDAAGQREVKLLDFGLVRLIRQEHHTQLTRPGAVLGTPAFMSPEQVRGESDVDHRTDLYAVGALLYTCLSGRRPFEGLPADILTAVVTKRPAPLRPLCPGLPDGVYGVVERAMSRDRTLRFPDARTMLDALDAAGRSPVATSVPPGVRDAPAAASRPPELRESAAAPAAAPSVPLQPPVQPARPSGVRRATSRPWLIPAVILGALICVALGLWVGRATFPHGPSPAPAAGAVSSAPEPAVREAPVAGGNDASPPGSSSVSPSEAAAAAPAVEPAPADASGLARAAEGLRERVAERLAAGRPVEALAVYAGSVQELLMHAEAATPEGRDVLCDLGLAVDHLFLDATMAAGALRAPGDLPALVNDPAFVTTNTLAAAINVSCTGERRTCAAAINARLYEYMATVQMPGPAEPGGSAREPGAMRIARTFYEAALAAAGPESPCGAEARAGLERLAADAGTPEPTVRVVPADVRNGSTAEAAGPAPAQPRSLYRSCVVSGGRTGVCHEPFTGQAVVRRGSAYSQCRLVGGVVGTCTGLYNGSAVVEYDGTVQLCSIVAGRPDICDSGYGGSAVVQRDH